MERPTASIAYRFWDSLKYYVVGLYDRVGSHHAFLMSGGVAFSIFSCTIPLTLIVFSVLGNIFERPTVVAEIGSIVDGLIPYPEQAAMIKDVILSRLQSFTDLKEVAGVIGLIGLLIAGSGLFSSLRTVIGAVYHLLPDNSAVMGKLWDLALLIILLMVFILIIIALPLLEGIAQLAEEVELVQRLGLGFAHTIMMRLITFVVTFLSFSTIYWLIPVRRPSKRIIFVSGLAAALLWSLARELFGLYISHAATLRDVYGIYAFLIIVAFWIYYSALVFIVGAEIGQLHYDRFVSSKKQERSLFLD
jgi:membrane protein